MVKPCDANISAAPGWLGSSTATLRCPATCNTRPSNEIPSAAPFVTTTSDGRAATARTRPR
ncbi:hypothetical protein F4560_007413 [Saccharothrix ecbatanensis]|uniref:Uncharacterized protein n=1 Tax=Saccharothrix ecbatanensis TaxID=1105145 RepID=A0A7W9HSG5_9PSEU|nr:hypothetical protein [Saccharothrix ecbatanensis]